MTRADWPRAYQCQTVVRHFRRLLYPSPPFPLSRNKLAEAFEGLPEDEPCAEDEIVVDKQDREGEAKAQMERPAPPAYHDHQSAGAPPPQHGVPPQQQYGAPPPQYYQAPPPPPAVYYTSASPVNNLGAMMTGLGIGLGMMGGGGMQAGHQMGQAPPPQTRSRVAPPPYGECRKDLRTFLPPCLAYAWSALLPGVCRVRGNK